MEFDIDLLFKFLVGVLVLANTIYTIKKARADKNRVSASEQITGFQQRLIERNEKLEKINYKLRERFDSVRASASILHYLGMSSLAAKWVKNSEGIRMHHNDAYETMTGYETNSCVGLSDFQILVDGKDHDPVHVAIAKKIARNWAQADRQIMRTGQAVMAVETCIHKDYPEEEFLVLVVKAPIKAPDGTVVGVEGLAIRIDDIERAKEAYLLSV